MNETTFWRVKRSRRGGGAKLWWVSFLLGAVLTMVVWPLMRDGADDSVRPAGYGAARERPDAAADNGRAGGGDAAGADKPAAAQADALAGGRTIRVLLTADHSIETVPLEWYVRGVVAGEMPADFELEALKAQAIAARTYIVRKLRMADAAGAGPGSEAEADVTDTTDDQVYVPLDELPLPRRQSGGEDGKLARIERAVKETAGQIVTYKGEPIQAAFFSTSNGYTENSEDYWAEKLPYLRSVPSPWDMRESPRYRQTVTMPREEFYSKLGVQDDNAVIRITGYTEGRRIAELSAGGATISGREARERLGLPSSHFTWRVEGDEVTITSFGYGHGVGMSQWGANALAKAGKTAEDILTYYYTGVEIVEDTNL